MNTAQDLTSGGTRTLDNAQSKVWQGQFGRDYTDRNTLGAAQLDYLWRKNYGISRSEINQIFLQDVPKSASILEVGCNIGNQLLLLQSQGYTQLTGVEIQSYALAAAKARLPNAGLHQGSALALPFDDNSFDLVFTSGVLIHIAPKDLPRGLNEIHRCARRYIWGAEYFSPEPTSICYRGHNRLLWKMDYAKLYLSLFQDIDLVHERRLRYLETGNVDSVFLLKKSQRICGT